MEEKIYEKLNKLYSEELTFLNKDVVSDFFTKRKQNGKTYIGFTFTFDYLLLPNLVYITYASIDEIKLYKNNIISMIPSDSKARLISKMLGFPITSNRDIKIPFLYPGDILYVFDLDYDRTSERIYQKIKRNTDLSDQDMLELKYRFLKIFIF